jgi:hypothetical protein
MSLDLVGLVAHALATFIGPLTVSEGQHLFHGVPLREISRVTAEALCQPTSTTASLAVSFCNRARQLLLQVLCHRQVMVDYR